VVDGIANAIPEKPIEELIPAVFIPITSPCAVGGTSVKIT
jgi:hypothetical protein